MSVKGLHILWAAGLQAGERPDGSCVLEGAMLRCARFFPESEDGEGSNTMSSFLLFFIPPGIEHLPSPQPWPRYRYLVSKTEQEREREQIVETLNEGRMGVRCTIFCRFRHFQNKMVGNK